jgi:tRNA(fMet)-specific endonuclease VapC
VAEVLLSKSPRDIVVSTITLYELEVGISKSNSPQKRRAQLESFVSRVAILPFGLKEAEASAKIRANLEDRGMSIGPLDNLIAGTAVCTGTILVTHNTKEFGRVAGLTIEDWF